MKGTIKYICLSDGEESKWGRTKDIAMEIYSKKPYRNDITGLPVSWRDLKASTRDEFYDIAGLAVRSNFVTVEYGKKNTNCEISLDFNEIWKTKQGVIDHITSNLD